MCWALKYQLNINVTSRGNQTFIPGIFFSDPNVCGRCGHISGVGTDVVIIFWLGILLSILEIILQADSSKQIAGFLQISSNICQSPAYEKNTVYPTFIYIFGSITQEEGRMDRQP